MKSVAIACALAAAASAPASWVGMPEGARQWIQLDASYCDQGTCSGGPLVGSDCVGDTVALPAPSPDYSCNSLVFVQGEGTTSPNRLTAKVYAEFTAAVYNSMVDTYTISGPPGTEGTTVEVYFRGRVTGYHSTTPRANGSHIFTSSCAVLEVGTWNPDTDPTLSEQFRVTPFDEALTGRNCITSGNFGASRPEIPFEFETTNLLRRIVGEPFDVAFSLLVSGSYPDESWFGDPTTAIIDIELPEGYRITSVMGWTDPDAPTTCPGDADGNGTVEFGDIAFVLVNFGNAGSPGIPGDTNNDGSVGFGDIGVALVNWGNTCS